MYPLLEEIEEAEEGYPYRVELLYHQLSYQVKGRSAILYRFSGKAARDLLLEKYKKPADEKRVYLTIPVTIYMKTIEVGKLKKRNEKPRNKKRNGQHPSFIKTATRSEHQNLSTYIS